MNQGKSHKSMASMMNVKQSMETAMHGNTVVVSLTS